MFKLRIPLVLLVVLALCTLVGCRLINPSDSDDNSAPAAVVTSQNLVIPVVAPAADVATATLTLMTNIMAADLGTDLTLNVLVGNVAKTLGKPKYWAPLPGDATKVILFYAETPANLGMTDTTAIGTFTLICNSKTITVPAGRFTDLLVTAANTLTTQQVVAGVAKAMGFATTVTGAPAISSTIPKLTLARDGNGDLSVTPEKVTITNGTMGTPVAIGTPGTVPLQATPPIIVLTHFTAIEGKADAAIVALKSFIANTRTEPGCLGYDLFQGKLPWTGVGTATNEFCLREVWKDQAAINFHLSTSWFATFFASATTFYVTPAGNAGPFDVTAMITTVNDKAPVSGMTYGFGQLISNAGQGTNAQAAMVAFMTGTRAEAGNIKFDVFQGMPTNGTSSGTFQIFESYAGNDAIASHGASVHAGTFRTAMATVAAKFWGMALTMVTTPAAKVLPAIAPSNALQPLPDISAYVAAMNGN